MCVKDNFKTFKYPQDAMTHGCDVFVKAYNEELESLMINRTHNDVKML